MTLNRPARLLLALLSGFALAAAYPNFNVPLIAWIALCPLILACLGASLPEAALCGVLHSFAFFPPALIWIYQVMRQYGGLGIFEAAGVLALLTAAESVFLALFCMGVAWVSRSSLARACLLAAPLWVATEFARAHLPYIAFPWNLAGYAIARNLAVLQLASVTGVYGLSLLLVGFNALVAWAIATRSLRGPAPGHPHVYAPRVGVSSRLRAPRRGILTFTRPAPLAGSALHWRDPAPIAASAAIALILVMLAGPRLVPLEPPRYIAHLVQTNFPQSEHYPADWMQLHSAELDQLEKMSIDAAQSEPGIVVWPEVPAPFTMQDPRFTARAERIARGADQDFLVGIVDWKHPAEGKSSAAENPSIQEWQAFNSAVLLDPSGQRVFSYDKVHLVPFGEYVPLRQYLTFAKRLTADISDFTPGAAHTVGTFTGRKSQAPPDAARAAAALPDGKFGVFICYESIFPDEVRQYAAHGAQLLFNLSNDGWFGRSAAPAQHLLMARVRAVESRRWLLRATNNGFTVSIDPYGRTVAELPTDVRAQLDAPYAFRSDKSLYVLFGDWIAWLSLLASLLLLAAEAVHRRI